jgi:hypothetical protein
MWRGLNTKFSSTVEFLSKSPRDSLVCLHISLAYIIVVEQIEHAFAHCSFFLKLGFEDFFLNCLLNKNYIVYLETSFYKL